MSGGAAPRLLTAAGWSEDRQRRPDPGLILSALPVAVVLLDAADRFRYANQEAEQLLGLSMSQLGQLGLGDLIPADNLLFRLIRRVRETGASIVDHEVGLESPRIHKQGLTVQGSPLPEEPGAVLLVLQDASTARALDRQLAFRGAARSVAGIAAVLAHEVKNPLSGLRGAAQLLEASVGAEDRELAVLIRDEADRIRALVDRMQEFGERPLVRGAVNIHRVLEHVRKLAETGFAAGVRFHELYDPSLPPAWGDRDQLVQAVLNLVKNAAEAIAGQAEAEVTLATGFQHGVRVAVPDAPGGLDLPLVVTVRDNGPGIAEDIRPHLFEPFVGSKAAGSGLGLALVAKIVGDHGGLIEVDSRPGRTEFRLRLPLFDEDDPAC